VTRLPPQQVEIDLARRTLPPAASSLARLSRDATFCSADAIGELPHICVDGRTNASAVLELSHWPGCATPQSFAATTATEIVCRYLDTGPLGDEVDLCANNHFDLDGLLGVWALQSAPDPGPVRDLAIAVARIGDFGVWSDPAAAKSAFALTYLAEPATSPLAEVRASRTHSGDVSGRLYAALLPRIERVLRDPDRFSAFWEPGWTSLAAERARIDAGDVVVTDLEEYALSVVRAPHALSRMALTPYTDQMRVMTITESRHVLVTQRYETWVAFAASAPVPRVDLSACAEALNARDHGPGRWHFDGLAQSTPRLGYWAPDGRAAPTTLDDQELLDVICGHVVAHGEAS